MAMGGFALLLRWLHVVAGGRARGGGARLQPLRAAAAARATSTARASASAACTGSSGIRWRCCSCSSPSRAGPTSSPRRGASSRSATASRRSRDARSAAPRWPWNRDKTVGGSAAFAIGGAAAGVFLAWWCRPAVDAAAVRCAFTIAAPIARGDRRGASSRRFRSGSTTTCRSPLTAGAVLWLASLAARRPVAGDAAALAARPPARGARRSTPLVAWARAPRADGLDCREPWPARSIGIAIFVGSAGAAGAAARHVRRRVDRVAARPAAQDAARHRRGARRTARRRQRHRQHRRRGHRGALVGADRHVRRRRAARVRGRARGRRQRYNRERDRQGVRPATWSITTLARVPPGTSGAMSLEGTRGGRRRRARARRRRASRWGWRRAHWLWAIVVGATAGSLLESWLGATLEAPGYPQQRHAQLHQHRRRRRSRRWRSPWSLALTPMTTSRRCCSSSAGRSRSSRRRSASLSGAATAYGAAPREAVDIRDLIVFPLIGALMAAVLNAASNALNQIYDLEIDRVNKPKRPLTSGRLSMRDAWIFTLGHLRDRAGRWPGWSRPADGTSASGSCSSPTVGHRALLGAAAAHQAARHLGQHHDRHSARRAAQGRRLVVGQDHRRRSSRGTSARSSGSSCSAPRRPRTSPTWKATRAAAAARCRSSTASAARRG